MTRNSKSLSANGATSPNQSAPADGRSNRFGGLSAAELLSLCGNRNETHHDTNVQEGTVLLATIRYLLARKAIPYQVSFASGQGIDSEQFKY